METWAWKLGRCGESVVVERRHYWSVLCTAFLSRLAAISVCHAERRAVARLVTFTAVVFLERRWAAWPAFVARREGSKLPRALGLPSTFTAAELYTKFADWLVPMMLDQARVGTKRLPAWCASASMGCNQQGTGSKTLWVECCSWCNKFRCCPQIPT